MIHLVIVTYSHLIHIKKKENLNKTNFVIFKSKKFKMDTENTQLTIGSETISQVQSTKFLGLHLDSCLNWSTHIKNLCSKLSKNLHLLRNVKKTLPYWAMRKLYFAYINCHITYGLSLWGSMCSKADLNRVTVLQKKAIRVISNSKYNAPTDPLFRKFNILKINDTISLELCKLSYQVSKNKLPQPILNMFQTGSQNHQYNTRNRDNPTVPKHKSALYNQSFLCRAPILFSNLNDDTKNVRTLKSLTKKFKKTKISNY